MIFSNRVAIVTGAGTGIGKSCAEQFAKHGASVVVNYSKSKDAANQVVAGITAAGGTAIALQADVSDEEQVKTLVAKTVEHFGGIDYLINNAGWSTRIPHHELDRLTDEVWDKTLDTNLRGAFYCVRACVPHLKKRPGSGIVNIASVAGFAGMGSSMVYAASKGAMLTMTKSLARALAPEIRVNAVAPGFVRTAFAGWTEDAFASVEKITPLGHLASGDDIAGAAVYLAGAISVTAETIVVDSGMLAVGPRQ